MVAEGAGAASAAGVGREPLVFVVTLSSAVTQKVRVRFSTADETAWAGPRDDHLRKKGRPVFKPDQTQREIAVTVLDDQLTEGTETFRVILSKPKGAPIADGTGVGTILDDDPPAGRPRRSRRGTSRN